MKLWLVRHARPLVEPGVCYGASDVAADAQHTAASARALAAVLPHGAPMLHSPLQRCAQLAQTLQGLRPDLQAAPDARLAEMDFGCWEGVRWEAISKADFEPWTAAFGDYRFGGRESVNELLLRVAAALTQTRQRSQQAVWITHAGVIRAASLLAQGVRSVERAEQWPQHAPACGEWLQLEA
jgi:alpha-ribazole phosphatase